MTRITHQAGAQLILVAAIGSGLSSGPPVFLRARMAELARPRSQRHP